jgi:hypothetical protein
MINTVPHRTGTETTSREGGGALKVKWAFISFFMLRLQIVKRIKSQNPKKNVTYSIFGTYTAHNITEKNMIRQLTSRGL